MTRDFQTARKLWQVLAPRHRAQARTLLFMMVIGTAFEVLGVGFVIPALGLIGGQRSVGDFFLLRPFTGLATGMTRNAIIEAGMLGLVLIYLVKNLYLAWLESRQAKLVHAVYADLSTRLFRVYLAQPYAYHLRQDSAQLIATVTKEIETLTIWGMGPGLTLIVEFFVVIALGLLLFTVEPFGAALDLAIAAIAVLTFNMATGHRMHRLGAEAQFHEETSLRHLKEALGGVRDVHIAGAGADFVRRFRYHVEQRREIATQRAIFAAIPRLLLEFLGVLSLGALTLVMIARGAAASSIISTIGLFAAVAFRLLPSSARILTSLQSARFAHAAIDRVHGDITSLESSAIGTTSERLAFGSTLELRAISYRYEGADRWALHHVDCAIQRGELVGISGPSGSGKTTLIDIMFGLLSPSEGVVLVDGRDLSTRLRAWQNQLGYVSQFVFLSNDSVRRNVAFGVLESEIQDDDVWRALAQAGVDTLFRDLPAGLATVLGEAGTRLSGGERQRIGIARALYHDPAIVLLDEATSALDVATERAIIETVDRLRGRKTVVIVSHRATALQNCDRVLTLENGSLAQAVSVC